MYAGILSYEIGVLWLPSLAARCMGTTTPPIFRILDEDTHHTDDTSPSGRHHICGQGLWFRSHIGRSHLPCATPLAQTKGQRVWRCVGGSAISADTDGACHAGPNTIGPRHSSGCAQRELAFWDSGQTQMESAIMIHNNRLWTSFLVLPGGASAGCRGPPLSGGHPLITSAQDRGASWRQLAPSTNDPRLMQNAAKGSHIVAGRRKTTPHRCRTQQNDTKLMQHAHSLENEVLL